MQFFLFPQKRNLIRAIITGLALHTFHGNFFVRSTDLLSLPNVNPDAGFGMQVAIEDDLRDTREVTFQVSYSTYPRIT